MRIVEQEAESVFAERSLELDQLATATGSVYLSTAWLQAWSRAFAPGARCLLAVDARGAARAVATVRPLRPCGIGSAANLETDDWTVVGDDEAAQRAVWKHLAEMARGRLQLVAVPEAAEHAGLAREVLTEQGYHVAQRDSVANPRLELPSDWDTLIGGVSRNTRAIFRRRHRALNELGIVRLRTSTLERCQADLECFYRLEASGWKGRAGTAIAARPRARRLYDHFVGSLARQDQLRLQLLEVDGVPVAADLGCTFAEGVFMLKTAFDETWARCSPGLVLRGEALRSAVEDGQRFYDFLGPADDYKLRWGATAHPHVTISAFRGPAAPLAYRWHAQLRPQLKVVRARAESFRANMRSSSRTVNSR